MKLDMSLSVLASSTAFSTVASGRSKPILASLMPVSAIQDGFAKALIGVTKLTAVPLERRLPWIGLREGMKRPELADDDSESVCASSGLC